MVADASVMDASVKKKSPVFSGDFAVSGPACQRGLFGGAEPLAQGVLQPHILVLAVIVQQQAEIRLFQPAA
jgi:hypothetical protein